MRLSNWRGSAFPITLITSITHWAFGGTPLFRQLPSSSQGSPFDDPFGITISIHTKPDVRNERTDVPDVKRRITLWWQRNVVGPQQAEKPFLKNVLTIWLEVFGADDLRPIVSEKPTFSQITSSLPMREYGIRYQTPNAH